MSKILKNTTASPISITDTGVTILASPNQYTIPPQDYLIWAASDNVITRIGSGNLIVNDGSVNLGISDGIDLIKGIYQKTRLIGNTDDTQIGNVGDRLKVDANVSNTTPIPITGTVALKFSDIQRNAEFNIALKVETDIAGVTYTVGAGKTFYITQFACASDSPSPVSMRIRVYAGVTLINTIKINLMSNGAWGGHSWPNGVAFATAGQIVKATFDPQSAKGAGWSMFAGFEV